jgi:hypothetical protein
MVIKTKYEKLQQRFNNLDRELDHANTQNREMAKNLEMWQKQNEDNKLTKQNEREVPEQQTAKNE